MSNERARLLLHPVRMRVVIALSGEDLTTRQIGEILEDVPQASLYRAIAQLHEAEIIEVVDEVRRGGAIERTYRMVPANAVMAPNALMSGTPEELLGAAQTFADVIVDTTARHLSVAGEQWREDRVGMRHEALWITAAEREELAADIQAVFAKYLNRERSPQAKLWAVMVAIMRDQTASRLDHEDAAAES
ncbi:helix-turn-helix domain-containing protein [Demequina sp. NBRC 110053]|uniref:helix-turn-helix domain-containing protein n=1 Tax=Demequina sp. NBRC 110053 TaxID=1570342 RepID=UPI001356544A|nr:helix-turn-helix domain-containing protein [Demequina sp. NBRC 110053]